MDEARVRTYLGPLREDSGSIDLRARKIETGAAHNFSTKSISLLPAAERQTRQDPYHGWSGFLLVSSLRQQSSDRAASTPGSKYRPTGSHSCH